MHFSAPPQSLELYLWHEWPLSSYYFAKLMQISIICMRMWNLVSSIYILQGLKNILRNFAHTYWYLILVTICEIPSIWNSSIKLFFCGKSSGKTTPTWRHVSCSWIKDVGFCGRFTGARESGLVSIKRGGRKKDLSWKTEANIGVLIVIDFVSTLPFPPYKISMFHCSPSFFRTDPFLFASFFFLT